MITLTGVATSGIPHLGNYVGAIRPSILSQEEAYFFLADLHALIKCADPNRLRSCRRMVSLWYRQCRFLSSVIDSKYLRTKLDTWMLYW
jgi:tryptophanyl-tRNA synthetase